MSETKEPKRYVCVECGHKANRPKIQRAVFSDFTQMKVSCCPKCLKVRSLKENPEWLEWLRQRQEEVRQLAIQNNNGYLLGVDVMSKQEREEMERKKLASGEVTTG